MKGHGQKHSRKQEAAIAALLSESSIDKAAKKAGIAHLTLRKWMEHPEFAERYKAEREAIIERVKGNLVDACTEAVERLRKHLWSGSKAIEVQAARAILQSTTRALGPAQRIEMEHRGRVDHQHEHTGEIRHVHTMTDEQLEQVAATGLAREATQ